MTSFGCREQTRQGELPSAVEMTRPGNRGKVKSNSDFSTVSTALGNPAKSQSAGFPHSHSAGGETYLSNKTPNQDQKPRVPNRNFLLCSEQELSTLP